MAVYCNSVSSIHLMSILYSLFSRSNKTELLLQLLPFYGHYTGQSALASTRCQELEDFVGAKFYCQHALADGNQRIRIREKMLEFSSTALPASSPYHQFYSKREGLGTPVAVFLQMGCLPTVSMYGTELKAST